MLSVSGQGATRTRGSVLVLQFCNAFAARSLAALLWRHGAFIAPTAAIALWPIALFVYLSTIAQTGGGGYGRYACPGALGLPLGFAVSNFHHVIPVEQKGRSTLDVKSMVREHRQPAFKARSHVFLDDSNLQHRSLLWRRRDRDAYSVSGHVGELLGSITTTKTRGPLGICNMVEYSDATLYCLLAVQVFTVPPGKHAQHSKGYS